MNVDQLIPNKDALIYLASPYSHPDSAVIAERYREALSAARYLAAQGRLVFSPIVNSHPLSEAGLPKSWKFWRSLDLTLVRRSDFLLVLTIPGYETSVGVCEEVGYAELIGKPVGFMNKTHNEWSDEHSDTYGVEPGTYDFKAGVKQTWAV